MLADLSIEPINCIVVFLKKKGIALTNGEWRTVIDVDMNAYEETVATLKADISLEENRKEITSNFEMKQITTLLNILEVRLYNFQQLLPKLDRRRDLINFCGTILNSYLSHLPWLLFICCMKRLRD